ncbi:MAG: hypothetical protein SCM11_03790, partial [Bacillota bacterium]|nr:hypothetical protein [Bacillota bacterium]
VSDICGKPFSTGMAFGAAFGDALLAALGTGHYKSLHELRGQIRLESNVTPDPARHSQYDPYLKIYTELYQQTKNLMAAMPS